MEEAGPDVTPPSKRRASAMSKGSAEEEGATNATQKTQTVKKPRVTVKKEELEEDVKPEIKTEASGRTKRGGKKAVAVKNESTDIDEAPTPPGQRKGAKGAKGKGTKRTSKSAAYSGGDASPYPDWKFPSDAQCHAVRDALATLHGEPNPTTGLEKAAAAKQQQPVLDSLVRTILSQNTTDRTSARAFASLKEAFPTWGEVLAAPAAEVEESIREGGLAEIKVQRIKTILTTVKEEAQARGEEHDDISLEYLREKSDQDVKDILGAFKGVGPKTISCVLMFTLGRAEFPVDTHVWHIAKKLKWVPPVATRETTYDHLNCRVPASIKYDLHVLLVDHGKRCKKCSKNGRLQKESHGECPLVPAALESMMN